jgi:hypothetical protein
MVFNLTHSQLILRYKENGGIIEPYTIVIMGQTADFTLCAHSACAQYLTVQARANYYLLILLFNLSIFFQIVMKKYVEDQKSSIFVIIAPNNLN